MRWATVDGWARSGAADLTLVLAFSIALVLAGCGPSRLELPTTSLESCSGYGIAAVLRGDASDPDVAWIERHSTRERIDVIWPTGFTARFDPGLEILDSSGRVVMREGDYVNGTCGFVEGREMLAPPFLALRLDCGPLPVQDCQLAVGATARANGWPDREIAEIQFLDSEARYRLVYEDGSTVSGKAPTP